MPIRFPPAETKRRPLAMSKLHLGVIKDRNAASAVRGVGGQRDENRSHCGAAAGACKDATGRSLNGRASVPPLTRPLPPGSLRLGFHRGILSLRDLGKTLV